MAETVFTGQDVEKLPGEEPRQVWLRDWQYSRSSRNTSSCVTVQLTQAIASGRIKSQAIWMYQTRQRCRAHLDLYAASHATSPGTRIALSRRGGSHVSQLAMIAWRAAAPRSLLSG